MALASAKSSLGSRGGGAPPVGITFASPSIRRLGYGRSTTPAPPPMPPPAAGVGRSTGYRRLDRRSAGKPQKPISANTGRALRSDPTERQPCELIDPAASNTCRMSRKEGVDHGSHPRPLRGDGRVRRDAKGLHPGRRPRPEDGGDGADLPGSIAPGRGVGSAFLHVCGRPKHLRAPRIGALLLSQQCLVYACQFCIT